MRKAQYILILAAAAAFCMTGCSESGCEDGFCAVDYGVNPEFTVTREPLTAQCSIAVEGYGAVAMETDYVPNVTWCENGNAPEQALNAQACSARTFAYYKIAIGKTPVKNSQDDQVYKCPSRPPSAAQLERTQNATNATSGYVMTYKGTITAGFYVSGVTQKYLNSECKFTGNSSSPGWVSQQQYVTYNWGKSGTKADGFTQSSIGWVNDGNYANRGCMSQNGASCLANNGWEWMNILRFFYGADINIEKASGTCVAEDKKCETKLSKSGTVIDDQDPCFSKSSSPSWFSVDAGHGGHLYYTYVWDKPAEVIGTWNIDVTRPGTYEVFVYLQSGVGAVSEKAPYEIRASGQNHKVSLDMTGKTGWVSLGKYAFASGGDQYVRLHDSSGEKYTDKNGKRVLFDAIKFEDAASCTNACTEGAKQCSGNGFQTCAKGGNGCTAWSAVTSCGANQTCRDGACVAGCTDACTEGAKQCSGNGLQTCIKGAGGCAAWGGVTACGADEICRDAACVKGTPACAHECNVESAVCDGNSLMQCGQFDDDECLDYKVDKCGDGMICRNGACVPEGTPCESKCAENTSKCVENAVVKCVDDDGDGCFEWASKADPCAEKEVCADGMCKKSDEAGCLTEIDGRPSVIIDETDGCFSRNDSALWNSLKNYGYRDALYYARTTDAGEADAQGRWTLNVTKGGKYTISAYIESGAGTVSENARYRIRASGETTKVAVNMAEHEGWVKLGDFQLAKGALQYVELDNATGEEAGLRRRVLFDAVKIEPYGGDLSGDGGEADSHVTSAESSCAATPLARPSSGLFALAFAGIAGFLVARRRRENEKS